MGKEQIKVLHIDTEQSWRGGQQQEVYLFEGMLKLGYDTCMVCQPDSAMEEYCQENKLPYKSISFAHEFDYKSGKALAKFANSYGASILHLHTGHSVSWGLWAKLFSHKLKLVATRRVDFSIKKNPMSVLKYNTKLLDSLICISETIKQVLIQDGIPAGKLKVIHSGIDINRFTQTIVPVDFRQAWGIPQDAILVGTIAAFVGHKDYPNFIKAASIVISQYPNVWFMAVSEGELFEEMKLYAKELNVYDKIIFTGFQQDVGEFLKAFDIFVLASKKEGLGTSVLDAMSVGLPIIGTQAGGIPEMINNRINGLLVPVSDSTALSNAIIELANNPELRVSLAKNALQSVKAFDINITITQNIELYREISGE